jgi:hypothetical protein
MIGIADKLKSALIGPDIAVADHQRNDAPTAQTLPATPVLPVAMVNHPAVAIRVSASKRFS